MKAIILAGGTGSRLHPLTAVTSKQLLPVYDKPMIYYPLSVVLLAGATEILIITNPEYVDMFRNLLGDGRALGVKITYAAQSQPNGVPEAFLIAEDFIDDQPVWLVLGDNIFWGHAFSEILEKVDTRKSGATIFAHYVVNPRDYGVAEVNSSNMVIGLEEKPKDPKSNWAVVGLYYYDNNVVTYAKSLKHSARGELEITDLNRLYMEQGKLELEQLGRGFAWFDAGNETNLNAASQFIETIEKRQGVKIACIEEVAFRMGRITSTQLLKLASISSKSSYGKYLLQITEVN